MVRLILLFLSFALCAQDWNLFGYLKPLDLFRDPSKCETMFTDEDPFSVSDSDGKTTKNYENFRSKNDYKKVNSFIQKRSIVKIKPASEEYASKPNYYIPVEVLAVPDTLKNDVYASKSKWSSISNTVINPKYKSKTSVGDKGFIYSKSLKKAGEYTYILDDQSPLIFKNSEILDRDISAIKPIYDERTGLYELKRCCVVPYSMQGCEVRYQFRAIYNDNTWGQDISVDLSACNVLETLVPFRNDQAVPLMNIIKNMNNDQKFTTSDLEMNESRSLVKVPLDYKKYDKEKGVPGPFGSLHYNPDDTVSSDVYANVYTNCVFLKVLERHQKECTAPGCELQFGNMFHKKSWGTHESHESGYCVDIRPLRKEKGHGVIKHTYKNYDLEKTRALIELLKKAGATTIIFNDKSIKTEGISRRDKHDNHIHVCFDPSSSKVRETCSIGIDD